MAEGRTNMSEYFAKYTSWIIFHSILYQLLQLCSVKCGKNFCHWGMNTNLPNTYNTGQSIVKLGTPISLVSDWLIPKDNVSKR